MPYRHTPERKEKIRRSKLKELNPMWKGDNVKIDGLHTWVKRNLPKPDLCQRCNMVKPYDLANITGNYVRDFENWQYLCRKCHMVSDDRLENNLRKARELYYEKLRIEIRKRICNICHKRSKRWASDIEGHICSKCYSMIWYHRKKLIGDITK